MAANRKANNWSKNRHGTHRENVRAAGKLLLHWVEAQGLAKSDLADRLGVLPSAATRWFTGERSPRPPMRQKIEKLTGIPASSWTTEAEIRWAKLRER